MKNIIVKIMLCLFVLPGLALAGNTHFTKRIIYKDAQGREYDSRRGNEGEILRLSASNLALATIRNATQKTVTELTEAFQNSAYKCDYEISATFDESYKNQSTQYPSKLHPYDVFSGMLNIGLYSKNCSKNNDDGKPILNMKIQRKIKTTIGGYSESKECYGVMNELTFGEGSCSLGYDDYLQKFLHIIQANLELSVLNANIYYSENR